MTTAINPYDHVLSELRIKNADMPKMSTPSTPPTYQTVKDFQKALNHNAMAIQSSQTELGHLALVISKADFLAANNNKPFKEPKDPGPAPTNTSSAATRSQSPEDNNFNAMESLRSFTFKQLTHQKFIAAKTALRNLILNSIDDKYINEKENETTGYSKVSPLDLMTYIWDTYATIDDADHARNEDNMKRPWSPPQPIVDLFEQLKRGQAFAAKGKETIDNSQLIRWGYQNIRATGLFDRACEKWRKKEASDKTWTKFKLHFTQAEDDRKKNEPSPTTTAEATFTANQVQRILQDELASIIDSSSSNGTTITESTPSPAPASANASITSDEVRRLIAETLETQSSSVSSSSPAPRYQRGGDPGDRPPRPPLVAQGLLRGKPVSYCWTHGITSNLRHTSASCRRKATGHQDDATYSDRKGGTQASLVPE